MNSLTRGKKKKAVDFYSQKKLSEAKVLFEQVCKSDKLDIESWVYLVKINAQMGNPDAVEYCCRHIIKVRPNILEAYFQLGMALLLKGEHEEAAENFEYVLNHQPNHFIAAVQLGKTFHFRNKFEEALEWYNKSLALQPNLPEVFHLVGNILRYRGDIEGAFEYMRRAVRLNPASHEIHGDLLLTMNYSQKFSADDIYQEHVRWGQCHQYALLMSAPHENIPERQKKLRIGYVSPDFCKHSVAFFFEPIIANHDRDKVDVYCYSEVGKTDEVTQWIEGLSTGWRSTLGMSDSSVAEQIRQDGIDILVDLAGHTAGSRLKMFSLKPAPVQMTYLGYPNTTGLSSIDYRITDAWADPSDTTDQLHTETLVRLPGGFLCYQPEQPGHHAPEVSGLPALSNSYVTFGSFNNLAKVTPEVVELWSQVLHAIPTSRLVIKNMSFRDMASQERYIELFEKQGIERERLNLLQPVDENYQHLEVYGQVDISLDTFPYNGTTTTCESLWMGVPCIALAGTTHAGRVGVSLLSQVGLESFIASTADDYVRIAKEMSSDLKMLAEIRNQLRDRMRCSTLCDAKVFVNELEQAYSNVWSSYCDKRSLQ